MKTRAQKGYKLYIVQKYAMARNVPEAIRKSKNMPPDEVYVSNDWKEKKNAQLSEAIGFDDGIPQEDEEEEA